MKKIIFATGNQDKMREIREILADMDVEVVYMKEAGIHPDMRRCSGFSGWKCKNSAWNNGRPYRL